MFICYIRL